MKRFLLWLCSKGLHRGDVTILFSGMTIVECRTCDSPVFYKWGKSDDPRGCQKCPPGIPYCKH